MYSLLENSGDSFSHPSLYADLLARLLASKERSLFWHVVDIDGELALSCAFERAPLQLPLSVRALRRGRAMADYLLDGDDELDLKKLELLIADLKSSLYTFYPESENEYQIQDHFLRTLIFVKNNSDIRALFKRLNMPLHAESVRRLIASSVQTDEVTRRSLRLSFLSALLVPLRQSLGSCFATAPAIVIQSENPLQLGLDLLELIETCRLKRTIRGEEIIAPLAVNPTAHEMQQRLDPHFSYESCPSLIAAFTAVGLTPRDLRMALAHQRGKTIQELFTFSITHLLKAKGDLLRLYEKMSVIFNGFAHHALLKSWEYTLATFSDYKIGFFRWNLQASLGFDPQEKGGIGEVIYRELSQNLEAANQRFDKLRDDAEYALSRMKMSETLLRNADSENRARQLKAEYQMHLNEFHTIEDMRSKAHEEAQNLSQFFQFLIKGYQDKFPSFFQEIYDPEMRESTHDIFSDSPAGFRLVYKHGRTDPMAWTPIYEANGFIQSLIDFLIHSESLLIAECDWEKGKEIIRNLTSLLIARVREGDFVSDAERRLARFHRKLGNLEEGGKHPWAYVAGGSMTTLVKGYLAREEEIKEVKKPIETALDLPLFLLEELKELPWKLARRFADEPHRGLLMSSPTHAFVLKPGFDECKRGWMTDLFTYTWVRDEYLIKGRSLYREPLSVEEQNTLLQLIRGSAPGLAKRAQSIAAFREEVLINVEGLGSDDVDRLLRQSLPIVDQKKVREIVKKLFPQVDLAHFKLPALMPYFALQNLLKALCIAEARACGDRDNYALRMREVCEECGVVPAPALIFADTNWPWYYFGMLYNPATDQMEMWRLDRSGLEGYPMSIWNDFLKEGAVWTVITEAIHTTRQLPDLHRRV